MVTFTMPVPADYRELSHAPTGRSVEAMWAFRASSAGEHLVLPDGRMDVVARYRLGVEGRIESLDLSIVGPSQKPVHVPVDVGDRFVGIRFRAGWGGACLGVDAGDLRDATLDGARAHKALGGAAEALRAARTEVELTTAMLAASRFDRHEPAPDVIVAIDLLHLSGGRLQMHEVARSSGMAERTMRRRVGEAVGLPVKTLAAVLRFQRAARLLAHPSAHGLTLAQAAIEGGYSDQAHMTREFRRFGGFTPGHPLPTAFGSLPLPSVADFFKNAEVESP